MHVNSRGYQNACVQSRFRRLRCASIEPIARVFATIVAAIAIAGCVTSPGTETEPEVIPVEEPTGPGTLKLELPAIGSYPETDVESEKSTPAGVFPITEYRIDLTGPAEASADGELFANDYEVSLEPGDWSVVVEAIDPLGTIVAEASKTVTIKSSVTSIVTLKLETTEVRRNLAIQLTWPHELISEASLSASVQRLVEGELADEIGVEAKIVDTGEAFVAEMLEPGHYLISVALNDGDIPRMTFVESVQVVSDDLALIRKHLTAADLNLPPRAATDPQVTATSDSSLLVTWSDVSDTEDGFHLLRKRDEAEGWEIVSTIEPNTTSFLDTGLLASTRYEYLIETFNRFGATPSSIVDGITANWGPAVSLTAPRDGASLINTSPEFAWDTVPGAMEYEIQISPHHDFRTEVISSGRINEVQFDSTEMLHDQVRYYWRVRGFNGDGIPGIWSVPSSFKIQLEMEIVVTPAPGAIEESETNPRFLQGQPVVATATLPGTSTEEIAYRWTLDGEELETIGNRVELSYHLPPGVHTLACVASLRNSLVARSVRFSVSSELAIEGLKPGPGETLWYVDRKAIAWDPIPTAEAYHLQLFDLTDQAPSLVFEADRLTSSPIDITDGLEDDGRWGFRIRAKDAEDRWSSWTPIIRFEVRRVPEPDIRFPSTGASFYDPAPVIEWNPVAGVASYDVRMQKSGGMVDWMRRTSASELAVPTPLTPGNWTVGVRAVTSAGESGEWSVRRFSLTHIPAPTQIAPGDGAQVQSTLPGFTWEAVAGADSYEIQIWRRSGIDDTPGRITRDPDSPTAARDASPGAQDGVSREDSQVLSPDPGFVEVANRPTPVRVTGLTYSPEEELGYGTYAWRVRARLHDEISGPFSEARSFEVVAPAPVVGEYYLSLSTTESMPSLEWYPAPNATEYELQIARLEEPYPEPIIRRTTGYAPETPLEAGAWKWRVRAIVSDDRRTAWSRDAGLEILLPPPADPVPQTGFQTSNRRPLLSWSYDDLDVGFELQIAKKGEDYSDVPVYQLAAPPFQPPDDLMPGTYRWRVRAVRDSGVALGAYSPETLLKIIPRSIELVPIDSGEFRMGSEEGDDDEAPVRTVRIEPYLIGVHEITQAEYLRVTGSNPATASEAPEAPVDTVSWLDAVRFCNALSELEGLAPYYTIGTDSVVAHPERNGYRLPTEAEWEYAAIGATAAKSTVYAGSSELTSVGWYEENSGGASHPVGKLAPNERGLFDMSGNVWEWTASTYAPYDEPNPGQGSSGFTELKVVRGGSWDSSESSLRNTNRSFKSVLDLDKRTGFRVVLDL